MLAFDVEATGLDQYAPGFKVFLIQWRGAGQASVCSEGPGVWWQPFLDAIEHEEVLVAANASYDIHALRESGIVDLLTSGHRVHDVLTLARVALPGRFSYRLADLGNALLGRDSTAAQRALAEAAKQHGVSWTQQDKGYYALWELEPELMVRYGMEDVDLAWDLWNLIWSGASVADCRTYAFEIRQVAPILRAAERDGVLVDKERLAVLRAHLEDKRDELAAQLSAQGLSDEALGGATKALLDDLLRLGVPLYRKTPKSGVVNEKTGKRAPDRFAVNKNALNEFRLRFPVVADLIAWRSCNQILSTFVVAMENANPRVHTSFNQVNARTSRSSSSKPNMQNLPRPGEDDDEALALGVRRVIVPAPGNALLVADYDGIEVRVLAHYIADPKLTRMLDAGMDMHALTASRIHGGRYEDFAKGGPNDKKRTLAKTTTFLIAYGGGANLLAQTLGCSTVEAAAIKAATIDAIPGYAELDRRIKRAVAGRAFPHVVTILGRRLHVPKDYVALNAIVQGTSAEIMKLGMVAAAPALAQHGYAVRLVVHDEQMCEGPACNADEALVGLVEAMESAYPLRPRLKVAGSWSEISYANAK